LVRCSLLIGGGAHQEANPGPENSVKAIIDGVSGPVKTSMISTCAFDHHCPGFFTDSAELPRNLRRRFVIGFSIVAVDEWIIKDQLRT
jgi:hypothetical protein